MPCRGQLGSSLNSSGGHGRPWRGEASGRSSVGKRRLCHGRPRGAEDTAEDTTPGPWPQTAHRSGRVPTRARALNRAGGGQGGRLGIEKGVEHAQTLLGRRGRKRIRSARKDRKPHAGRGEPQDAPCGLSSFGRNEFPSAARTGRYVFFCRSAARKNWQRPRVWDAAKRKRYPLAHQTHIELKGEEKQQ